MHKVLSVIVAAGDQAVVADGTTRLYNDSTGAYNLALGQLGVFNADTNIALPATATIANANRFYFAVGIDTTGGGTVTDILKSRVIDGAHILNADVECPAAKVSQVWDITGFTAKCDTEYQVKVRFKSVSAAQNFYGYEDERKTFSYVTSCCGDGCACPDGDCFEVASGIRDAINNQNDDRLTAIVVEYVTSESTPGANDGPGTLLADADVAAFKAANPGVCPGIRITASDSASCDTCGPPTEPWYPEGLRIDVGLAAGFDCNGTAAEVTALGFSEGTGCFVRHLEVLANGDNGTIPSPYRVPFPTRVGPLNALPAVYYTQFWIEHNDHHLGLATDHYQDSPLRTLVALPCGSNTTRDALYALLNAYLPTTPRRISGITNPDTCSCP